MSNAALAFGLSLGLPHVANMITKGTYIMTIIELYMSVYILFKGRNFK